MSKIRSKYTYKAWTPEEEHFLAEEYLTSSVSTEELAKKYGRTYASIAVRLNLLGIKKPKDLRIFPKQRKDKRVAIPYLYKKIFKAIFALPVNPSSPKLFKVRGVKREHTKKSLEIFPTDNKILGYICGLIATDGCLTDKGHITLELQTRDKDFLVNITRTIAGEEGVSRLHIPKGHNSWRFGLRLPKLYQYCLDMGITPRKSLTLDVKLDDKSDEFKLHFLRGALDGDGCVKAQSVEIHTASPFFKENLKSIIEPKNVYKDCRHPNTVYALTYTGKHVNEFVSLIPLDNEIFLKRKTEKLKDLIIFRKSSRINPLKGLA